MVSIDPATARVREGGEREGTERERERDSLIAGFL